VRSVISGVGAMGKVVERAFVGDGARQAGARRGKGERSASSPDATLGEYERAGKSSNDGIKLGDLAALQL
jgi:hypothetical protein